MREGYPNLKARKASLTPDQVHELRKEFMEKVVPITYPGGVVINKYPPMSSFEEKYNAERTTIRQVIYGLGAYSE